MSVEQSVEMPLSQQCDLDKIMLSQDPIFVVGYPRSGTTLLQALLATQKNIYSFPETHFFPVVFSHIRHDPEGHVKSACLREVLNAITEMTGLHFAQPVIEHLTVKARMRQLTPKIIFEFVVYNLLSKQVPDQRMLSIRWLEKTPHHAFHLDQLSSLYPRAQFVGIIRNPVQTMYSAKTKLGNLTDKVRATGSLAREWVDCVTRIDDFTKKNSHRICRTTYEALVQNHRDVMASICAFLDIDFNESELAYFHKEAPKLILSKEPWKMDVLCPEIRNTNFQYKRGIPMIEILRVQRIAHQKMKQHGYRLIYQQLQRVFNIISAIVNSFVQKAVLTRHSRDRSEQPDVVQKKRTPW